MGNEVKPVFRMFAWSYVAGLGLTLLLAALSGRPRGSSLGVLLAPGMLSAAIVFPQGIESDAAYTYMALAMVVNAFFLSWPLLGLWKVIQHFRKRTGENDNSTA